MPNISHEATAFSKVVQGFLRLHQFMRESKNESEEADLVRDSLDDPWNQLSDADRKAIQGLSADFYALSDPPAPVLDMNPQAARRLGEVVQNRAKGRWKDALAGLRRWRRYWPPARVSYCQGSLWADAGYPGVAYVYFSHAAEIDPGNKSYAAIALMTLSKADPEAAKRQASLVLEAQNLDAPALVVQASHLLFRAAKEMNPHDASTVYITLVRVLLALLDTKPEFETPEVFVSICFLLAECNAQLGRDASALDWYNRGLQSNPHNEGLLIGRGILQYGYAPQAIADFERAVNQGSSLVWPYFYLSHHYLLNERFRDVISMCLKALECEARPNVCSKLNEWLAIARAELGFEPPDVRLAFENAIHADPENDLARRNFAAYQRALQDLRTQPQWERQSEEAIRSNCRNQFQFPLQNEAQDQFWTAA